MSQLNKLNDLLQEIRGGAVKAAAPKSEPGGYSGASSHPSATADDGLIDARTGARAAENTADVKGDGEQPKVDAVPEAKATVGVGGQDAQQLHIGLNPAATGDDPSAEDDYKGDKDDPGTTSVMKADDGEKYAALLEMPFRDLAALTVRRGDAILAKLAAAPVQAPARQPAQKPAAKTAAASPASAAPVAEPVHDGGLVVADVIKAACIDADRVAAYVFDVVKQAEAADEARRHGEDADMGESHADPGDAASGAGSGSAIDGGVNAAGGAGGGDGSPVAPMGGPGMAAATAGAPGMDAPPDAGGAPASREEMLHELAAALHEMGIDPAELAAIAQQSMAPGAAPAGPDVKMAADMMWKAADAVRKLRADGRFRYSAPKTARAAAIRDDMAKHIQELRRAVA